MFFVLCKPIWSIYLFSVHPIQKTCETSILTTTNIFSFLSLCFEFWTFCASFSKTQICSKTTKHLKWWVKRAKAFTEFDSVLLTKMIRTGLKRPFDTINLKTLLKKCPFLDFQTNFFNSYFSSRYFWVWPFFSHYLLTIWIRL